jgi:hypothetical protein
MHSIGRIQVGERSRRLHDTPRTPLQRLLATGAAEPGKIDELVKLYTTVSPARRLAAAKARDVGIQGGYDLKEVGHG